MENLLTAMQQLSVNKLRKLIQGSQCLSLWFFDGVFLESHLAGNYRITWTNECVSQCVSVGFENKLSHVNQSEKGIGKTELAIIQCCSHQVKRQAVTVCIKHHMCTATVHTVAVCVSSKFSPSKIKGLDNLLVYLQPDSLCHVSRSQQLTWEE